MPSKCVRGVFVVIDSEGPPPSVSLHVLSTYLGLAGSVMNSCLEQKRVCGLVRFNTKDFKKNAYIHTYTYIYIYTLIFIYIFIYIFFNIAICNVFFI